MICNVMVSDVDKEPNVYKDKKSRVVHLHDVGMEEPRFAGGMRLEVAWDSEIANKVSRDMRGQLVVRTFRGTFGSEVTVDGELKLNVK